jgi:inosine-uridine nucleoside N-ribohydrolase
LPKFPVIPEDQMRQMLEPPQGRIRLLIDTDAHNEIDDQFAIAWALLSQDVIEIEGVLAEPYSHRHHREPLNQAYDLLKANPQAEVPAPLQPYRRSALNMLASGIDPRSIRYVDPDEGMELSYQEILKVFDLLNENPAGRVFRGSPGYLTSLDKPIRSAAAARLIERAFAVEGARLYVAAIGCLTNVASAILMEPEIIARIVVLWTSSYPSCVSLNNRPSLNLVQDILASQLIFDSGVPHVYLPGYYVGEQLKLSLPDMEAWVRGKGKIGDYLYDLYTHNPIYPMQGKNDHFGRTWVIWDLINFAWLLNPEWVPSQLVRAPILTGDLYWKHDNNRHWMREAYGIDRDAIFRDFFTKLEQAP